jgi:hypothetical protein
MRFLVSLILVIFLSASSVTFAGNGKVNFSGQWSINNGRSQFDKRDPGAVVKKLKVVQEGNNLSIERTSQASFGRDFVTTEKLTLDGKKCELDGTKKLVANWSKDGKNLTISSTTIVGIVGGNEVQKMEMTSIEIWKLTEDGNSLLIDSTSRLPRMKIKNTFIYDKTQ